MNYCIKIEGCAPVPLAYYLKALGILRIVSEQFDPNVRGCWQNDRFVLFTEKQLDEKGLINFFLYDYKPTPIVAPWNGGSGFYPKDNKKGISPIENSNSPRFSEFKETIKLIKDVLNKYWYKNKSKKEEKNKLLVILRNALPEKTLMWFDAAVVLTDEKTKYPPLLGTGGNDGRLDFTNNYMQRVVEMINPDDGKPTNVSEKLLKISLFAINEPVKIEKAPVGQFFPARAGGANQTRGFDSESSVNPWDFILMLEGALFFASACVRRLNVGTSDTVSSPFCVETTAAGYASASIDDVSKSRGELWMPIWMKPSSAKELMYIFTEGRAQVGRRIARNGLDFIRAAVTLGVDRGINAFQRYGFQERNGLAYFAFALDKIIVKRNVRADVLSEIDIWLNKIIKLSVNKNAPGSIVKVSNNLQRSIIDLCKHDDAENLQSVLISLGKCEKAFSKSLRWCQDNNIKPLSGLSAKWIELTNTQTPEFRLACSLVSLCGKYGKDLIPLRSNVEPVEYNKAGFTFVDSSVRAVWSEGSLVDNLNSIFSRRMIDAEISGEHNLKDTAKVYASLNDINAFIDGETDDNLIADLLWGLILVDWNRIMENLNLNDISKSRPNSLYALMKLCFMKKPGEKEPPPLTPIIHRIAKSGKSKEASEFAVRRLIGSNLVPAIDRISLAPEKTRRIAATLLFPISERYWEQLADAVLRAEEEQA